MACYYDLILAAIPAGLIIPAVGASFAGYSVLTGVMIGSLISVSLMGHGLFINGPTTPTEPIVDAEPDVHGTGLGPDTNQQQTAVTSD